MRSSLLLAVAASGLILGLSACAPTVSRHGYLALDAKPSTDIKVGDSDVIVIDKLGSPSQTSSYDPWEWYYVDQTLVKMTYKPTQVNQRNVTRIKFDPTTKTVVSVDTLTLADGRLLTPDPRKTPTRGRSLTALEQLLGTVGRQRIPTDDDTTRNRRRE